MRLPCLNAQAHPTVCSLVQEKQQRLNQWAGSRCAAAGGTPTPWDGDAAPCWSLPRSRRHSVACCCCSSLRTAVGKHGASTRDRQKRTAAAAVAPAPAGQGGRPPGDPRKVPPAPALTGVRYRAGCVRFRTRVEQVLELDAAALEHELEASGAACINHLGLGIGTRQGGGGARRIEGPPSSLWHIPPTCGWVASG